MTIFTPGRVLAELLQAKRLWLFLDYDGTLDEFAPTPAHILPNPEVIDLIARLAQQPRVRVAVISGRRLSQIQALLPVPGILLAGTYGIELQMPDGERVNWVAHDVVRPALEHLKPRWEQLIAGRAGFFLEDKTWALALHARFAEAGEAEEVLAVAGEMASRTAASGLFRVLGGHRFLEIAPAMAHKGQAVNFILGRHPWPDALPVYVGDDDKDEAAFGAVKAHGGVAVLVAPEPRATQADCRLESPRHARQWLGALSVRLSAE